MKILGDTAFTEMIKKNKQKLSFQFSTNSCSSGDADIDVPSSQNCNTLPVEMYVSLQKTLITTRKIHSVLLWESSGSLQITCFRYKLRQRTTLWIPLTCHIRCGTAFFFLLTARKLQLAKPVLGHCNLVSVCDCLSWNFAPALQSRNFR